MILIVTQYSWWTFTLAQNYSVFTVSLSSGAFLWILCLRMLAPWIPECSAISSSFVPSEALLWLLYREYIWWSDCNIFFLFFRLGSFDAINSGHTICRLTLVVKWHCFVWRRRASSKYLPHRVSSPRWHSWTRGFKVIKEPLSHRAPVIRVAWGHACGIHFRSEIK